MAVMLPFIMSLTPRAITLCSPDSYLEASASAGFAFGLLQAVRKKLVPAGEFSDRCEKAALKAVRGIVERIDETGELRDVR
jgi:unsaturated rhamnogalacturonyl hydrolase